MARPRSEDKRNAILAAATRVIAAQGLGAPTALIALEAGVSNGSLFTYFKTKTDLFNDLYLELKSGMASSAVDGLPARASLHKQLFHTWSNWMRWGSEHPERRRALALLVVCDEITPQSRATGHTVMAGLAELMERCRAHGSMRNVSMSFFASIMTSVADATIDHMIQDPGQAEQHCKVGFDVLWRAIT